MSLKTRQDSTGE
jgi:hypothetical protein